MTVLYVVSAQEAAGKTAICAGLGKYLQSNGRKVGFIKLIPAGSNVTDGDAAFIKQVLHLTEDVESLRLPADVETVKQAFSKGSLAGDAVIIEGVLGRKSDDMLTQTSYEIAGVLKAKVIVVDAYSGQVARYTDVYKGFGTNLIGVILNKVPVNRLKSIQDEASRQFEGAGMKVWEPSLRTGRC